MKISIRWIFDHIEAHWDSVDILQLVRLFNEKVAEVEQVEHITLDVSVFAIIRVTQVDAQKITGFNDELQTIVELSFRTDAHVDAWYVIKKQEDTYSWATLTDLGSAKDGLFPAFYNDQDGANWKSSFEANDVILHVDNKSVTNRPDLWGHRGFAREIAALLDMQLKNENDFLAKKDIQEYESISQVTADNPFVVTIKNTQRCDRFAGLYFNAIESQSSSLWMAHRLARIDARPIDLIVDATNYVMFDLGQPLHAFDAQKISTHTIEVQTAHAGQKLELLDGQTVELTDKDLIVSDGTMPLALAGIMGGKSTGISTQTQAIFLESAHFNATGIRQTSVRLKIRSEASARFEKAIDPLQNTVAIMRFLQLLNNAKVSYSCASSMISLGLKIDPIVFTISHTYIEQRIGTKIDPNFVIQTLKKLQFGVQQSDSEYNIAVPSFRATKDIGIKEDIVEEIARFYGYSSIPVVLPEKITKAHSLDQLSRLRSIKQLCAYTMIMREVYNYAFFDETFLVDINWEPRGAVMIKNPVSERYRRLITTLIPGLLNCLHVNNTQEKMRFFEWGRIWHEDNQIHEQAALAGLFFDKKVVDFYEAKSMLEQLFSFFTMTVEWQKIDEPEDPWFMPYQTAQLIVDGKVVGIAGKANKTFLNTIVEGDAFLFELNGSFLLSYVQPQQRYRAPSKYPLVERDISVLVPLRLTVRHVICAIKGVSEYINGIRLLDIFDKKEWVDQRSLTFRFNIQAPDHTLTKEEAELIWQKVAQALKDLGATVR